MEYLKHIAQDYIKRNSINFTNIRKTRTVKKGEEQRKSRLYDIENFTVSYSKNETFIRNIKLSLVGKKDTGSNLLYLLTYL